MCGIIGYHPLDETTWTQELYVQEAFGRLFKESAIRGLHAYGIARVAHDNCIELLRSHVALDIAKAFNPEYTTIAHTRYCQSGDWRVLENNQPIVVGHTALAFNGCIHMGTKEEFEAAFDVKCTSDNDGEVLLRVAKRADARSAEEFALATSAFVGSIRGSFAGVALAYGRLIVSHNPRRPLWRCTMYGAHWFASTHDIFKRAGFTDMEPVPVGTELI